MKTDDLDDLFATARREGGAPSPDLLARVMDDAFAHQPRMQTQVAASVASVGVWSQIAALFGGGLGLAGAMTATVAGLWFGFSPPDAMAPLTQGLWPAAAASAGTVEMIPGFDDFWMEG